MAEPYLSELRAIIENVQFLKNRDKTIVCKHFFGGAAAYYDGTIFMSLSPAGLALKMRESDCQKLFKQGGAELRYFPEAPVKKGYVVIPPGIGKDINSLGSLIIKSVTLAENSLKK